MLNKRLLRKYFSPTWKPNLQSGLLHTDIITNVVRSTVRNIGGTRVLILYVYAIEQLLAGNTIPCYTVFQSRKEYVTYEQLPDSKPRWRVCQVQDLPIKSRTNYSQEITSFFTKNDELRTIRFCDKSKSNGFDALHELQKSIFQKNCEKRKKARIKAIRTRMNGIGNIPKSVEKWLRDEVIPTHGFYTYRKNKKEQLVYCTHCQTENLVSGVRHAQKGICPCCGKVLTFHATGRSTRVLDRITAQFIEKHGDEFLLRIVKGYISYGKDYRKPDLDIYENARIFFRAENGEWNSQPYYNAYTPSKYPWCKGTRPLFYTWQYHFECDLCGHLYTANLEKVFQDSPWQYAQLAPFYLHDNEMLEVVPYLRSYLKYPVLEYLVKTGLFALASDFVYHSNGCITPHGKSIRDVLKISPAWFSWLREHNGNMKMLSFMQELFSQHVPVTEELLSWCQKNDTVSIARLVAALRYTTPHKLIQYLDTQFENAQSMDAHNPYYPETNMGNILISYTDYLDFCKKLHYDLADDFILFPSKLKEAHDTVVKLYDVKKVEMWNTRIAEAYPSLMEQYQFTRSGMLICAPKSAEEIVTEGQILHHCVKGYVERVARHETTILFLRKEEAPGQPYYTIELRDNKVQQIRGDHNCGTTKDIDKFMTAWERACLTPVSKAA